MRRTTGSIQKRGKASWRIRYYSNGVRQYETVNGTMEDAQNELAKRLGSMAEGLPVSSKPNTVLFAALASDVITDYEVNEQRSLKDIDTRFKLHVLPVFGHLKAAQITTSQIKNYIVSRRKEGAANASINRELTAMKRAFNLAIEGRKLMVKPFIPMLKEDNVREGFFTRDEVDRIASHLPVVTGALVLFGFLTGWRFSEIRNLKWRNVDFQAGEIRLNPGETKNGDGRTFPMTNELRGLLESMKVKRVTPNRKKLPDNVKSFNASDKSAALVFTINGIAIQSFPRSWATANKKAGLPYTVITEDFIPKRGKFKGQVRKRVRRVIAQRLFHDLRRSAVREFIRRGIPERVAMKLTGHRSRSVFDRYDIVSESDLRGAADTLNRAKNGSNGANS